MEVLSSQVEGVTLQQLDCTEDLNQILFFAPVNWKTQNDVWRNEMQPDENL